MTKQDDTNFGKRARILIAGASGQLGRHLVEEAELSSYEPVPLSSREMNITDLSAVRRALASVKPAVLVNAAAYTHVDNAEKDPAEAFLINEQGPSNLSSASREAGIPLIHISTDYVFDGRKKEPYEENDPVCPLGVYGKSKAAGERAVISFLSHYIIIRTSWLYGFYGHNFVKTIMRLAREKELLSVVNDQHGCPTYAGDLATAIFRVIHLILHSESRIWGIYHYCGKGNTTWYDFAREIVSAASRITGKGLAVRKIDPIPSSQYRALAERPSYSILDTRKIEERLSIQPVPWKERLHEVVERLVRDDQKEKRSSN